MGYAALPVSALALLPSLLLCLFIYYKDRVDKEPVLLLLLLFGAGAVTFIPSFFCEKFLTGLFDSAFLSRITFSVDGVADYSSEGSRVLHCFLCGFGGIALAEEGFKWIALVLITYKNRNFNCLFDGVIYSTFVSLGYAGAESVRFAFANGWDTLPVRVLTFLPAHLFFGTVTGIFYTLWHAYSQAEKKEKALLSEGRIEKYKKISPIFAVLSFGVPYLFHGIFGYISINSGTRLNTLFYALAGILYVICFICIFSLSKHDDYEEAVSERIIIKRHPSLKEEKPDG